MDGRRAGGGGALATARPGALFRACVAAVGAGGPGAAAAAAPPPAVLARLAPALVANGSTPSVGTIMGALGKQHASGLGGGILWGLSVEAEHETGGQTIKLRPAAGGPSGSDGDSNNATATPAAVARRALASRALAFACRAGWAGTTNNCTDDGPVVGRLVDAALGVEQQLAAVPLGRTVGRVEEPATFPPLAAYLAGAGVDTPEAVLLVYAPYFHALFLDILPDPAARAAMPAYFVNAVTVDLARRDLLGGDMTTAWAAFLAARDPHERSLRPSVRERCVQRAVEGLPDEVARAWVAENVVPADTAAMAAIFNDTRTAAAAVVAATPWLDGPSKAATLRKINDAVFHNGGDPAYDPYTDVAVVEAGGDGSAYVTNTLAVAAASWRRVLAPLTSPAAAVRWRSPAFVFDASYTPSANRVTMTWSVQRWPLLPPAAAEGVPAALAYGGAAFVAGHEFGHALDVTGIFFNASGRLVPASILSPAAFAALRNRTDCLVDQYSGYAVEQLDGSPPIRLNGALTLGENMADAFGVRVAADALRAALRTRLASRTVAASNPVLAKEFTDEQLYWVGVAQTWCVKRSDTSVRRNVATGPHSLEPFRVLGPASHSAAFAQAFDCPVGSPYRPAGQRCTVYGA